MEEKEVMLNEDKIKVVTKLSKEEIEDNNVKIFLDDTIDLEEVVKEIKNND